MSFGQAAPRIQHPPPGPRSRALGLELHAYEAPGINTLVPNHPNGVALAWAEAYGSNVRDLDGNVYIDFTSGFGVAAIGHRHPRVVAAIRSQADQLLHGLGDVHPHPLRAELARKLTLLSPFPVEAQPQVYFATSGAEAVEIALKTALAASGRSEIAAFAPSYHGLTLGALAVTSRPEFRIPFAPHLHSHVHHFPYGEIPERLSNHLERRQTSAVIVEPIVGREGVLVPAAGWLRDLSALCRSTGTLLIADEIFTGFGRTGYDFAVQRDGVLPDLLCCGKALGGGLPIAAVLAPRELFRVWESSGEALHTATFAANPLACAAALAALDVFRLERLSERSALLGIQLQRKTSTWVHRFPAQLEEARACGLLAGLAFHTAPLAKAFAKSALHRGILLLAGGPEGRVAQLIPPLTITEPLLSLSLAILEQAFLDSSQTAQAP